MLRPDTRTIVCSAAACLVAIGVLVGYGRSLFAPASGQPCDGRFAHSALFRFEQNGTLLTGADILSRAGADSVGVLENIEVMRPRDSSIATAMQIELRSKPAAKSTRKPGVRFPWQPRAIQNQTTACLSYKVFFYGDLEFQDGGVLPGLLGLDPSGETHDRFAANLAWRHDGQPGVNLVVSVDGEQQAQYFDARTRAFARAGWIKIDQEVVLNEPGRDNGILRVWVDGELALEKTNVSYRTRAGVSLAGAATSVGYGSADIMTWAPSDTRIWISPVEISWP